MYDYKRLSGVNEMKLRFGPFFAQQSVYCDSHHLGHDLLLIWTHTRKFWNDGFLRYERYLHSQQSLRCLLTNKLCNHITSTHLETPCWFTFNVSNRNKKLNDDHRQRRRGEGPDPQESVHHPNCRSLHLPLVLFSLSLFSEDAPYRVNQLPAARQ